MTVFKVQSNLYNPILYPAWTIKKQKKCFRGREKGGVGKEEEEVKVK